MAFSHPFCGGKHEQVSEARLCEQQGEPGGMSLPRRVGDVAIRESNNAYERQSGALADEGFYKVGTTYFKVQKALHGSGRLYAKELVQLPEKDESGKLISKGHWEMARGVVYRLRKEDMLTGEEAAKFGQLYGICVYCWSELTDERSIAVGYGPTCAENRGLPWGETA
jgi:hypothetical protein